ncbi:hypothetical protein [Aquisalibacillus elongatus]|uniref:Uncharacterized protein n=1 Tax=Aquisalibacillus elongatus TaxID=485577 RepID=A0A3N5C227_9BACI|nr:hypothetical protein [Aquisalibacillus elongatus]RPF53412.1 hypothetical protein EDC24_1911 [Aquisalibacillus elongatus]
MHIDGQIISGDYDQQNHEFSITSVKHLTTESTITEDELGLLHDYLLAHTGDGGQVLTLNDQILVKLNEEDVEKVLQDLEDIKRFF